MTTHRHLAFAVLLGQVLGAQDGGARAGLEVAAPIERVRPPDPAAAERVITVEGVAELRLEPTELRLVFSVIARGETAVATQDAGRERVAALTAALAGEGIEAAALDVDFIALLPVHEWAVAEQSGRKVLAERRTGFSTQHNVHVRVADEARAKVLIAAATRVEGVELLAVDYWSSELQAQQVEAQRLALAEARRKADVLLAVFEARPPALNVHEATRVIYPQHLYVSFSRAQEAPRPWSSDMQVVPSPRPLSTYYRGLYDSIDVRDPTIPTRRQIHVVATVRLYFAAPGRELAADPAR